ncbi:MAG TPA: hypothetical protein VG898_08515 [Solirubrobacterales bacterium]|nr:hypothetical protein [Solirubrobacterales bacterium]
MSQSAQPSYVLDFLDREHSYLQSLEAGDYLRGLERYLDALKAEPLVGALLQEVHDEAANLVETLQRHDEALVPRVVELRDELVSLEPEEDNTAEPRPSVLEGSWEWEMSVAGFDATLEGTGISRYPVDPTGAEDATLGGQLLGILCNRVQALQHQGEREDGLSVYVEQNQRPDLDELRERLSELAAEHQQLHQRFVNAKRSGPGPALLSLEDFVSKFHLAPPPPTDDPEASARWMSKMFREAPTLALVEAALYSTPPTGEKAEQLDELVETLRGLVDRLHHGLSQKVSRHRTRQHLLRRFKARCEAFDAADLRETAQAATQPELPLAQEAARFFFDQGLNPLTETSISGGLRPDILDPFATDSVYVEAKQVGDDSNAAADIVGGARQLYNTLRRMKGEPFNISEAFLLVFRRGGPDVELPASYRVEDWTIFPLLIDIAPSSQSGSRQRRRPISLSVEDLAPQPMTVASSSDIPAAPSSSSTPVDTS